MTSYHATHKVTKHRLGSGFDTEAEAKAQAEWLANTYGGVAKVSANYLGAPISKFSAAKGWH